MLLTATPWVVQDANPDPAINTFEPLRWLGQFVLDSDRPTGIWRSSQFTIDPRGRFVILEHSNSVLVFDGENGTDPWRIELPESVHGRAPALDGRGRVIAKSDRWFPPDSGSPSFVVDLSKKEVATFRTSTPMLPGEQWMGAAGPDRDLLVSWNPESLRAWTETGALQWTLTPADRLAHVDAVCATTNGLIAVLDARGEQGIQLVYPEGRVGPYVHLEEAWGRETETLTNILPAEDGGIWVVEVSEHGVRLTRIDLDGRVLEERTPRYRTGARLPGGVAVDRSGQPWMVDEVAFVRVGPEGWIDRVVGEPRDNASLREATKVRVGPDGRIYAVSTRDRSVHVFDDTGRKLRVARPTGYGEDGVTPQGLGELEWVEKGWFPVGETGKRWEVELDRVRLVDPARGEILAYREKDWPENEIQFEGGCTTPGGTLAVAVFRKPELGHALLHVVLLDPDASEPRKIRLPEKVEWLSSMAFDGKRIVIANDDMLEVFDEGLRSIAKVKFPPTWRCGFGPDTFPRVDFARGGTEIWFREGPSRIITRYALP